MNAALCKTYFATVGLHLIYKIASVSGQDKRTLYKILRNVTIGSAASEIFILTLQGYPVG